MRWRTGAAGFFLVSALAPVAHASVPAPCTAHFAGAQSRAESVAAAVAVAWRALLESTSELGDADRAWLREVLARRSDPFRPTGSAYSRLEIREALDSLQETVMNLAAQGNFRGESIASLFGAAAGEILASTEGSRLSGASARETRARLTSAIPEVTLPGSLQAKPVVLSDGTLVFTSTEGGVHFLNSDGSLKTTFRANGSVLSQPILLKDETIVIAALKNTVHFLTPDGAERGRYSAHQPPRNPVELSDGTVAVQSDDHSIAFLSPDGSELARYDAESAISGSLATLRDGTVAFLSNGKRSLHFVRPDGNSAHATLHFSDRLQDTPIQLRDGTIVASSQLDRKVYFISETGRLRNAFERAVSPFGNPVELADGGVAVSADRYVHILDSDGVERRNLRIARNHSPPLQLKDGTLVIDGRKGLLRCIWIVRPDGTVVEKMETQSEGRDGSIARPLLLRDGRVLLTGRFNGAGAAHVLDPSNGSIRSLLTDVNPAGVSASPVELPDGTVIIARTSGTIHFIPAEML